MGESDSAPWRFSPLEIVAHSLAFVMANLRDIAVWSAAPVLFGLGFHLFMPGAGPGGEAPPNFVPVLFLMAFLLLWIRVPLEVRLCRKALLDEPPGHFYGLELVEARSFRYLGVYIRVIGFFIALLAPAMLLLVWMTAPVAQNGAAGDLPEAMKGVFPALGMIGLLAVMYAALAPRVIVAFPDVALGGPGLLLNTGRLGDIAGKARWRMVAVMAIIWAPEHSLNAMSYLGQGIGWWKDVTESIWFIPLSYFLGFATLIVSSVAGAFMYARLRAAAEASTE
jgi:hypothetical protein